LNLIDSGNFDGLSPEPLKELIALADDLKTRGVQLRSVTEGINTTTLGGELVFHLFAAIAQFERNLIRERTRAGLTSAKARGKVGGRPKKMKPGDIAAAKALLRDPEITVEEAAKRLGVHPVTPHIVVATDFSEASRYALESTARIFPERKLTLFHASEAPLSGRMMNAESHRRGLGQFRRRRGLVRQIALTAFLLGATVIEFHYVLCAAARSGCSVAG
jgi:hypothetical protein